MFFDAWVNNKRDNLNTQQDKTGENIIYTMEYAKAIKITLWNII